MEEQNGKQVPVRVGMAPEQRAGIEYEFTVMVEMDFDNTLTVSKTRCDLISGMQYRKGRTIEVATTLRDWLQANEAMATPRQIDELRSISAQIDEPNAKSARRAFRDKFGDPNRLTEDEMAPALEWYSQLVGQLIADAAEAAVEVVQDDTPALPASPQLTEEEWVKGPPVADAEICLLYTSDAADE